MHLIDLFCSFFKIKKRWGGWGGGGGGVVFCFAVVGAGGGVFFLHQNKLYSQCFTN